jgi:hypothetical protein
MTEPTIPLWAAISTSAALIAFVSGIIAWVFMNFAKKSELEKVEQHVSGRITAQETLTGQIARDVSYIRGKLEPRSE